MYFHPRMFYSNISLENKFAFKSAMAPIGRGFVLDWLDPNNFIRLTTFVHFIEKFRQIKGQFLLWLFNGSENW